MQKLSETGLALIKKKYGLISNTEVASYIGVDFSTLWRALNKSAGGEFVAKTLRACPGLAYHDLFFDDEIASLQRKPQKKGG